MKRNVLFLLFFLSCNITVFSSCSEEPVYDGELYVTFDNAMKEVVLYIYDIGNTDEPIYRMNLYNSENFELRLDRGNYLLKLVGEGIYNNTEIGFQIKLDARTWIHYNESNSPSLKEF